MKIVLFEETNIFEYNLSALVSDTFSSVENIELLNNLVDISIKNNEYKISTKDNTIYYQDKEYKEIYINKNEFYKIIKGNKEYLLLVQDIKDETLTLYKYQNELELTIGNNCKSNIIYNIP